MSSTLPPRGHGRSQAPAPLRHAKASPRRPLVLAGKIAASTVAVVAVSALAIAGIAVGSLTNNVQKNTVHLAEVHDHKNVTKTVSASALQGEFNVLLVGSDTRTDQGGQFSDAADQAASSGLGNNDVTMMLHVNAAHTAATVISFPRDMIVPIPACPNPQGGSFGAQSGAMLNTTLSEGGLSCPVATIESLMGISNIDYAAEITFDGVAAMSNAVGGVPVCLASPLDDPYVGLNLPAGTSTLKGQQALEFLRSRHGVDDGSDLSRISSQQNFLSSLMRTIASKGVLSNPVVLFQLADAATKNLTLSSTMASPQTLVGMGLALKGIPLSQITFVQYPVVADPTDDNRVIPDSVEGPVLAKAIQDDEPITLTAPTGRGTELAPGSAATPSATTSPSTSTPAPSTAATSTPAPSAVALGQNATGQTAAQETCTKGVNANF